MLWRLSLFLNGFPHFLEDLDVFGIASPLLKEEALDDGFPLVIGDLAICNNNGLMRKHTQACQSSELIPAFGVGPICLMMGASCLVMCRTMALSLANSLSKVGFTVAFSILVPFLLPSLFLRIFRL